MNNTLTVQEQVQKSWKIITLISAVLCAAFLGIFWYSADPFWAGIFRLASFIFFAATVFGCLKLMNSPLQVRLSSTDELLLVSYYKKEKKVHEEQFERAQIKRVLPVQPSNFLQSYLQSNSSTFKINFTDTDRDLYLFQFSGRPLLFGSPSQQKIKDFLKGLEINT